MGGLGDRLRGGLGEAWAGGLAVGLGKGLREGLQEMEVDGLRAELSGKTGCQGAAHNNHCWGGQVG